MKFTFHDPDVGIARAHRNCMNTIRAAIGEGSFWLGCGSFIPSGAELMDGSRICADIGPFWPAVRWNSQSAIFSSHLHGNAFLIDPDFAVFRGAETMDVKQLDMPVQGRKPYDPLDCNSGPPLSEAEARQWASATILCGGLVVLSDKISAMNERGLAIIRSVLDHCGGNAARAIDFAERVPSLWFKNDRDRCMLGVAAGAVGFVCRFATPLLHELGSRSGANSRSQERSESAASANGARRWKSGAEKRSVWMARRRRAVKFELEPRTVKLFVWSK